jgi:hypothetical protein
MKTKWQFFFETADFHFEKETVFKGNFDKKAVSQSFAEIDEKFEFELNIVPDIEKKIPSATQTGTMFITIPFNYEEGKDFIKFLAHLISQRIAFNFGQIKIHSGLLMCERIPETPEEKELIGDKPFAAEMHLQEVLPSTKFDSTLFINQSAKSMDYRLIEQHNIARHNINPVEKYLGFCKVIESMFGPQDRKTTLEDALLSNPNLYNIFKKVFIYDNPTIYAEEYKKFIKKIVNGRHKCAHMKLSNDFGYWSSDPRVKDEIEPYLQALEMITYYAIQNV